MACRWNEETTMRFVEEYLLHECLWNYKNADYRNKQKKQTAINDIVSSMGLTNFGSKDVELKIRSIRSTYSQELKKWKSSTRTGTGVDEIKLPNLKWFSLLYEALKSISISEPRETHNNEEAENNTPGETDGNTTAETESQQFVAPLPSSSTRKRRLRELLALVDKVGDVAKSVNASTEHEFDFFGKSVASQLKAMPLTLALQAQQHIQNYISQLRIQNLNNATSPSSMRTPTPSTSHSGSPSPSPVQTPTYSPLVPEYHIYSSPRECTDISATNDILAEAFDAMYQ